MIERVFAWMDLDDDASSEARLRSFRWVVGLALFAEILAHVDSSRWGYALASGVAAALGCWRRTERVGSAATLSCTVAWGALFYPAVANHLHLLALLAGVLAFVDARRPAERRLALSFIRWYTCIFILWTGLQKVWWGLYFDGRYLAYLTASLENYATALRWLFPDAEIDRLAALDRNTPGSGPFRVESFGFVALSNAIWLTELVQPVLLALACTRRWGVLLGIAMMLGMQLFAREVVFGTIAISMILLFARQDWLPRLLPLWIVLYAWLVLTLHNLPPTPHLIFY